MNNALEVLNKSGLTICGMHGNRFYVTKTVSDIKHPQVAKLRESEDVSIDIQHKH